MYINLSAEDYPDNYDWITKEKQEQILSWFEECSRHAEGMLPFVHSNVRDISRSYHDHYVKTLKRMQDVKDFLGTTLGIYVDKGWVGHRDKWFLATYNDAMLQEDFLFSMMPDG